MSEFFSPGQRWISNAEPELGLGIIIEAANRRVLIAFPASEEERTYAADSAPLSRVQFQEGDQITIPEHEPLTVLAVETQGNCLVYIAKDPVGNPHPIPEQILSARISLSSAKDRLLAGQVEHHRRFELRVATLEQGNAAAANQCRGLLGPRVQLLPHQFYIAHQAAQREHVRLLLADEVGLGKTIEAGLIIHQRLLEARSKRVLILVPETLVNQWLVEMLRRFNLSFSVFDEARCREIDAYKDDADSVFYDEAAEVARESNPFETAQLIIASIDWLAAAPRRARQLRESDWDMLVVDEAHNQHWQENTEPAADYQLLETLCGCIPSVLMLTATPENAGIEGHFARLRLLDPERYPNLDAFREEQAGYAGISALIERLQGSPETLAADPEGLEELSRYLGQEQTAQFRQAPQDAADETINALLDRFGTGRSLFRNSRASIGGFPARRLHEHPLESQGSAPIGAATDLEAMLHPELQFGSDWVADDPRLKWLEKFLLAEHDKKVLLICAHAAVARDIELYLRLRRGIASAAFDEDMTLLERDRAAAYFADPEDGAQLLVCSEIGSEGRNFQFAEHLVLFDLPLNPDLLEQRIGRLDRIGRSGEIHIHVPYLVDSPQQSLLRWYRDALNIFATPCTIGSALMAQFETPLKALLQAPNEVALEELILAAATQAQALREELTAGRNRLLELNSCRRDEANALVSQLGEEQRSDALANYLELLADQYGLEHEDHSENTIILRPGDHMLTEAFPHLPEEGFTGTFDRSRALSREDIAYLSWEHPLVHDAMMMISTSDFGSAAVCTLPVKGLPPGTLLLEAYFNPGVQAPAAMQLSRFLPGTSMRLLIDRNGKNLSKAVSHERLNQLCQNVKRKLIPALMRQLRNDLGEMVQTLDGLCEAATSQWRGAATESYLNERNRERQRLVSLAERNSQIGSAEIDNFDEATQRGEQALEGLQLNLYALRLAITS
jgi:ATP-dependent helicase HepA